MTLKDRVPSLSLPSIGRNRTEAAWRFGLGVIYYLLIILVGPIIALVYALFWLADVLYQGVTNRDGLGVSSPGARFFDWQTNLREYILFGEGDRPDRPRFRR